MIDVRPFDSLGGANHGWLDAKHHFSFGGYRDGGRMGWGSLRVWNDDLIAPKTGFPPHPHSDMEIITYVREGAITHEDNQGNKGRTESGVIQIWKMRVLASSLLNSECAMPDPADITCTSPASVRPLLPWLSSCVMAPSRT
jgi:hypothetical protein